MIYIYIYMVYRLYSPLQSSAIVCGVLYMIDKVLIDFSRSLSFILNTSKTKASRELCIFKRFSLPRTFSMIYMVKIDMVKIN